MYPLCTPPYIGTPLPGAGACQATFNRRLTVLSTCKSQLLHLLGTCKSQLLHLLVSRGR